jgi:hypothetical protein
MNASFSDKNERTGMTHGNNLYLVLHALQIGASIPHSGYCGKPDPEGAGEPGNALIPANISPIKLTL